MGHHSLQPRFCCFFQFLHSSPHPTQGLYSSIFPSSMPPTLHQSSFPMSCLGCSHLQDRLDWLASLHLPNTALHPGNRVHPLLSLDGFQQWEPLPENRRGERHRVFIPLPCLSKGTAVIVPGVWSRRTEPGHWQPQQASLSRPSSTAKDISENQKREVHSMWSH